MNDSTSGNPTAEEYAQAIDNAEYISLWAFLNKETNSLYLFA